jgi:hypothetical protein
MEAQIVNAILNKNSNAGTYNNTWFYIILPSHGNKNKIILTEKHAWRTKEKNKRPRNKPRPLLPFDSQQNVSKNIVVKTPSPTNGVGKSGCPHVEHWVCNPVSHPMQ